jgi:hypothetical protein
MIARSPNSFDIERVARGGGLLGIISELRS